MYVVCGVFKNDVNSRKKETATNKEKKTLLRILRSLKTTFFFLSIYYKRE